MGVAEHAIPCAEVIARHDGLKATVCSPQTAAQVERLQHQDIVLLLGPAVKVTGYLGQFLVTVQNSGSEQNLARLAGCGQDYFDIVLDLGTTPAITHEVLPPGYFSPGRDKQALSAELEQIPELAGEFEKPKYFNYDPDICAHGNSGLTGCTRCIDTCSASAITSHGDEIVVDPHLCQGLGNCATVCPSGAISYACPQVRDQLADIRQILRQYREQGGQNPVLLIYDAEDGQQKLASLAGQLAENIIPVEVEAIGAVGLDTCLAALAYGAQYVVLLTTPSTSNLTRQALLSQMTLAAVLLEGMDIEPDRLILITPAASDELVSQLDGLAVLPVHEAATFAAFNEKRTTLFLALDHLYRQATPNRDIIDLPAGAPFGGIQIDKAACTLCMACVSVCPVDALEAGTDRPLLAFIESNCVQCGLCASACPEQAIQLIPRFVIDRDVRRSRQTLHEEQPFYCVVCNKPFASQSVIKTMHEKLGNHWMFQSEQAQRRIEMCEDCRVKDMLAANNPIDVHKNPQLNS